ncbi:MAG: hypothetical protein H6983_11560 [Ectothiorhodospiraceae bacterium]|nr:hypothetical protein [Ectothiorhodospiraceae bacterium]
MKNNDSISGQRRGARAATLGLASIIALGAPTAALAGRVEAAQGWVGQYISTKQTTMTIQSYDRRSPSDFVISGQGRYSIYKADCVMETTNAAHCSGKGTRLEDRREYRVTYYLRRQGSHLTSDWSLIYPSTGETYSGQTRLQRVSS